jgi:hypothetical protein
MRLFQKAAVGIMILFFGLMALVTIVALTKRSGSTGMDMMNIHVGIKKKLEEQQLAEIEKK